MYAASAAAFLAAHSAQGEVVYTDVDPDVTVDIPGTGVELDLNDDGVVDFTFFFTSTNFFYFTYWGGLNAYVVNAIFASPKNENGIAALSEGGGAYAYPYAISSGLEIGPYAGNFMQNAYQTLVYQFYAIISSFFYYPIVAAGEWIFGQADKFVGLQLQEGDSTYYGWIRLTVDPSNRAFTIKDIAYENTSDTPIETFITPTDIRNVSSFNMEIYAAGPDVHIVFPAPPAERCSISVYDLTGKLMHSEQTSAQHTTLSLPYIPSGNYIIHCSDSRNEMSKQLFLHK